MAVELDITTPTIRRIHSSIKAQQEIEVKLLTGDEIKGKVRWIDDHCLCIGEPGESPDTIIWHHAIAFIKV
jgi:host factor-I protein